MRRGARLATLLVLLVASARASSFPRPPNLRPPAGAGAAHGARPPAPRAAAAAEEAAPAPAAPRTSVPQASLNLVKNIAGTGVLTLPSGVSRLVEGGASPADALAIACALLLGLGVANGAGFYLIGEACEATGASTYADAWRRTLGPRTALLPLLASLLLCFTSAVSCVSVIGDTVTDLLAGALGVPYAELNRAEVVLACTAGVGLPLCLLPSLGPLAFASLLGVGGTAATAALMGARCADGSYGPGGALLELAPWGAHGLPDAPALTDAAAAAAATAAGHGGGGLPDAAAISFFLSLCSNAFLAHYNAPALYGELDTPGSGTKERLRRFGRTTTLGFAASAALFVAITAAGYATFGADTQPNILSNYAPSDHLAFFARAGIGLSVLFELPLIERPFRAAVSELCLGSTEPAARPIAGVASLALICAVALAGIPLDALAAIGGGSGGALLIYVAPALMALQVRRGAVAGGERAGGVARAQPRRAEGGEAAAPPPPSQLRAAVAPGASSAPPLMRLLAPLTPSPSARGSRRGGRARPAFEAAALWTLAGSGAMLGGLGTASAMHAGGL